VPVAVFVQYWGTIIRGTGGNLSRAVHYGSAWEYVRILWEEAFHLLFFSVRGCHLNGLHLVPKIDKLAAHLGVEASLGEGLPLYIGHLHALIIEMYRDNDAALSAVDQEFQVHNQITLPKPSAIIHKP
jgi:hypothetical protein